MKEFLKKIFILFTGRKCQQKLFKLIFKLAVSGMNIGNGGDCHESGERRVINKIFNKKRQGEIVVFDVGANEGSYANMLKEVLTHQEQYKIHCFEPAKDTFDRLSKKISGSNFVINNFGFGDKSETITLYKNNDSSGLASVYNRKLDYYGIELDQKEEIILKKIDEYCEENNINRLHLLKLDIEGHEFKALEGAIKTLEAGKIDTIQFEFGGCNIDAHTYFRDFWYLLNGKYNLYRIVKDGLYPIYRYEENLELFMCTNFFAIKKDLMEQEL